MNPGTGKGLETVEVSNRQSARGNLEDVSAVTGENERLGGLGCFASSDNSITISTLTLMPVESYECSRCGGFWGY